MLYIHSSFQMSKCCSHQACHYKPNGCTQKFFERVHTVIINSWFSFPVAIAFYSKELYLTLVMQRESHFDGGMKALLPLNSFITVSLEQSEYSRFWLFWGFFVIRHNVREVLGNVYRSFCITAASHVLCSVKFLHLSAKWPKMDKNICIYSVVGS